LRGEPARHAFSVHPKEERDMPQNGKSAEKPAEGDPNIPPATKDSPTPPAEKPKDGGPGN